MTDRELLELAAKAADIKVKGKFEDEPTLLIKPGIRLPPARWNPLTDDGDALRLAVKLEIDIERDGNQVCAWYEAPRPGWDNGAVFTWTEPLGSDPYAATRRAIVRAAASIGGEK